MADEETRYYWCMKCGKAVDLPADGRPNGGFGIGKWHWRPQEGILWGRSDPCGPVVVR